ncbi:hypothetical protein O9929_11230 [Vibrio lentus]|nr:hypothetical protein [Vibrio lentus]
MGVAIEGQQGQKLSLSYTLDTRYFLEYNQIRFELITAIQKQIVQIK